MTELPSAYDPTLAESKWYPIWERAGYFTPNLESEGEPYAIVIPPPNVTGSLHMGHALTVTIEDALIRWRRMQGRRALWVPGVDHAGIATQMVVERELRKEGTDRHTLGREAFLERVWAWKRQYGDRITNQLRVLGCSVDWTRERFTMDEGLSAAVREVFVRLYDEGLIYRANRLINWCPRCHTALSDLEVEHDEAHQGELWHFAYPSWDDPQTELVVATTRPETMLGDTAVAVHPDDARYTHLIGKTLRHPILGYPVPVIGDAVLVDPEFGTGAVKVTPAHDFNDFETGKRNGLDLFSIFDQDAKVLAAPDAPDALRAQIDLAAWGQYAGLDRFAARKKVKADLAAKGLERESKPHTMALGHCQRCETVVEPRLSTQWFVRTAPLAQPALEAVRSGATQIIPEVWTKTYYHWMENIQDWCISRQLWWGHRIPAWYGPDGEVFVARSEAEARAAAEQHYGAATALSQDDDVLDTWFSSALWPFSTLGWPEQTKDLATFYPNSVMETGFDILFFWVARMMMMGCKLMGQPPFPVIYLHAMVRDKNGDKMSKTKGNVIDPLHLVHGCGGSEVSLQFAKEFPEGFPAFGADAVRFTLAAMSATGRDIRLSVERIDGYRAFANKIWNASRFALMRIDAQPRPLDQVHLEPADRFILSRLAAATESVDQAMEAYRFADAAGAIYSFFWDELCDWYIELVKPRLGGSDAGSKAAASSTLVYTLDHALRLLHPFMPFITEEIWQRLPALYERPGSIMVAPYPKGLPHRDAAVEDEYALVQSAIVGIRTVRTESNVPPSKPVHAQLFVLASQDLATLERHRAEIMALARLESLTLEPHSATRPADAAIKVQERLEVAVPLRGLVDFAAEAERLRKAMEKTLKEREKIAAKLENPNFVARAPAEVVAKDKERLGELDGMLASLAESLSRAEAVG